jgi:hypothetical protein
MGMDRTTASGLRLISGLNESGLGITEAFKLFVSTRSVGKEEKRVRSICFDSSALKMLPVVLWSRDWKFA